MVFSSLAFIFLFLPTLLLLYYFPLFKGRNYRNVVLFLFSLLFYSFGGWRLMPIILFSIVANYIFGRLVSTKHNYIIRRASMFGAVVCNIGVLIFYKYLGFLSENVHRIIPDIPLFEIILPIGISFYTFQSLSYVIDVYRCVVPSEPNILRVALYIVLFPQLVAGPIVRYSTIAGEISCRTETMEDFSQGTVRFLLGLGKKVLIANQVGQIADAAFKQSPEYLSAGLAWLGVVAYTAQIYFDFSGYSDMAIGLGRMFGFHFLENFNYPYISQSITEFWRRWHISLSTWFRDYLYIPLGGNRGTKKNQIRNLLIIWGLTGLWHGAAWNYIFWGLYYAVLLIGERYVWGDLIKHVASCVRHIYTLFFVMVGWLIFRASGIAQIASFLSSMSGTSSAGFWNDQATFLLLEYRWELLAAIIGSLPIKTVFQKFPMFREKDDVKAFLLVFCGPLFSLTVGTLSVVRLVSSGFNPFIYFQF